MYDLHSLGWYGFQELCNSISREILGQTSMTFLDSADGGRDGCFSGKWRITSALEYEGEFVIQCKFKSKPNSNLRFSDISNEIAKAQLLTEKGLCDVYILMTNAGVTAPMAEKIQIHLKSVGVKHVFVFGSTWVNAKIKESSNLRRLVPRVYGLGDLTQILDERVYRQGAALLESLREDLAKVVITTAYNRAAEALNKHGFVLLIGEPAAGKTTVASLLAMGALDQWKALSLKLSTAEQVKGHWNPDEPDQFFWVDDAFGVTQYEHTLTNQWNHFMPEIKAMLNKGAKIVMTSRDYIYKHARKDLKGGAFPLMNESQVVIDIQDLSIKEKRQILYNHIKMGKQSKAWRKQIKPFLEFIAEQKRFIPETARRIADPFFTKNLNISEFSIGEFVKKQESFLFDVIEGLDKDSKAALALIYMNNDQLKSPLSLSAHENDAIVRIGSTLSGCILALEAMEGNMLQKITFEDELIWKFKHPTIGDAFAKYIVTVSELLQIYIQGSTVDKLLEQVTCGDVNLEKAVIVPKTLFPLMLEKLKAYNKTSTHKSALYSIFYAKRNLLDFLSTRCSLSFIKLYLEQNASLLDEIADPDLLSYRSTELRLASVLHKAGLLPDSHRKAIIEKISKYALNGENVKVLDEEDYQLFFSEEEFADLKKKIEIELLPNISQIKNIWISKFRKDEDAEYHMSSLIDNLRALENEFSDNEKIGELIEAEIQEINGWVEENTTIDDLEDRESLGADLTDEENNNVERSIFDDIDV